MEYKVITTDHCDELENEVNEAIREGWKPQGGVLYVPRTYMQAMIKESNE